MAKAYIAIAPQDIYARQCKVPPEFCKKYSYCLIFMLFLLFLFLYVMLSYLYYISQIYVL
jgi:hypothetical protein